MNLDQINLDQATPAQLKQWETELTANYQAIIDQNLSLDLTRGKPSAEQLSLSDSLDGILNGNYKGSDGTDVRNYGGLDGLPEAKQLGAELMNVDASDVLVGGNASLTLMFQAMLCANNFGLTGPDSAWNKDNNKEDSNESSDNKVKFICPVPGYDRHYTVCEQLNIEMINVNMTADGPDMDTVEALVKADSNIKGIWCVPKYSNPTGVIYSDETVDRIAQLGKIAGANFRVFWDNAYAVHDLGAFKPLASIKAACEKYSTQDSVLQFGSTSKITFAGAGVAFMAASKANLTGFKKVLGTLTIGPDKVNQLRTVALLPNKKTLLAHMQKHAAVLAPRFAAVLKSLGTNFGNNDLGNWEKPEGGYFVSFDTRPGVAVAAAKLSAEAGVKLTPAGATFPYGRDPEDCNIRIAPSVPTLPEVEAAMKVFAVCVKLASVRIALASL